MKKTKSKLRVHNFSLSLDGYACGRYQSLENPLGVGGLKLHEWAFATKTFREMFGDSGGSEDIDNEFVARGLSNIGAWIIGRNMFGPFRGPWKDENWKGWWGGTPPYHSPVFVLTHHARPPISMRGDTDLHFVTSGIHVALQQAVEAANGADVRLGGGVVTIRQFLRARLIDEMHIAVTPIILGDGEPLFFGINLNNLGYKCTEHVPTKDVTHIVIKKV